MRKDHLARFEFNTKTGKIKAINFKPSIMKTRLQTPPNLIIIIKRSKISFNPFSLEVWCFIIGFTLLKTALIYLFNKDQNYNEKGINLEKFLVSLICCLLILFSKHMPSLNLSILCRLFLLFYATVCVFIRFLFFANFMVFAYSSLSRSKEANLGTELSERINKFISMDNWPCSFCTKSTKTWLEEFDLLTDQTALIGLYNQSFSTIPCHCLVFQKESIGWFHVPIRQCRKSYLKGSFAIGTTLLLYYFIALSLAGSIVVILLYCKEVYSPTLELTHEITKTSRKVSMYVYAIL